jgi:hypothetical protein
MIRLPHHGIPPSARLCRAAALALVAICAACGGTDDAAGQPRTNPTFETAPPARATEGATGTFGAADVAALARGLRAEIAAVQIARTRGAAAKTPEERGAAAQEEWDSATIPLGAQAAGLTPARYRAIRTAVNDVLSTLDFQGKIAGPLEIDFDNADAATKARIQGDAFAALPPASAAALRADFERIAAVWIEYTTLTAQNG